MIYDQNTQYFGSGQFLVNGLKYQFLPLICFNTNKLRGLYKSISDPKWDLGWKYTKGHENTLCVIVNFGKFVVYLYCPSEMWGVQYGFFSTTWHHTSNCLQ